MNNYDILKAAFPNIRSLDTEFYTDEPYKSSALRRCKILVFMGALSNHPEFAGMPHDQQNLLVRRIEIGCVNATVKKAKKDNIGCSWQTDIFMRRYSSTAAEKAAHLDWLHNQYLSPLVLAGTVPASTVGFLTDEECQPNIDFELKQKIQDRKSSQVKVKVSNSYTCPQCTMKSCTVTNLQLRGLDEGKTTNANCTECGFQWTLEK